VAVGGCDASVTACTADRSTALRDALQALPERQRTLMQMLLTDREPSYAEISAALDMPVGSIGPTRARCIARLRSDQRLVSCVGDEPAR
jgi:DNA-directed RNA polymerase specialized sigma24 family protein